MSTRPVSYNGAPGGVSVVATTPETSEISELNHALSVLAIIFPTISPEVFRETLQSFSGQSRLQVAVNQLLKNQDRWVRGRWRTVTPTHFVSARHEGRRRVLISAKDRFRSAHYKWAVYTALCKEFKYLNRSVIKAVLAEENHDYSQARGTLQKLAARSWRGTLSAIWTKWRKPAEEKKPHFMITWQKKDAQASTAFPVLRESGDAELDTELYEEVLAPYIRVAKREQELTDREMAIRMSRREASEADALYECQCCFTETTFEQMAVCSDESHVLCNSCIRHAVTETLYGQGWGKFIDHNQGLMKCLAPSSCDACAGLIPHYLVEQALLQSEGGSDLWSLFELRLTEQALANTSLPLVRCPFCSYAEVDELYLPRSMVRYRPNTRSIRRAFVFLIFTINFVPLIMLYYLLCRFALCNVLPTLTELIHTSTTRLARAKYLPRRFNCRSQVCGLPSCLDCAKVWQDPHVCHESAALSLKATIESARTAALKRTCPRCNLAFIKDSGCNKLTCLCGYSMCYICRQGLGKADGGEGYRHFCQHFRPSGGTCSECDKCDLYRVLDDGNAVVAAGIRAETEWREREGMVGVGGIGGAGIDVAPNNWTTGEWSIQAFTDWWVAAMITC